METGSGKGGLKSYLPLSYVARNCDNVFMLALEDIRAQTLKIAQKRLGSGVVKNVVVEEDSDMDGRPCLRVTLILKSGWDDPPGIRLGNISLELIDYLAGHDDGRFPYTHYVTAKEYAKLTAAK